MENVTRMKKIGEDEYRRMPGERADIVFGFIMQQIRERKDKKHLIEKLSKPVTYTRVNAKEQTTTVRAKGISRASLYRYLWYANPTAKPKKGRDVVASEDAKIRICHELGWDYISFIEDGCLVAKNGEYITGLAYDATSGSWESYIDDFDQTHLDKACEEFIMNEKCSHVIVVVGYVTSNLHYSVIQNKVTDVRIERKDNVVTSTIADLARGIMGSYRVIQIAWVAWYAFDYQPDLEWWLKETMLSREDIQRITKEYEKAEKKEKRPKKPTKKPMKKPTKKPMKKPTKKSTKKPTKKTTKKDKEIKKLKQRIKELETLVMHLSQQIAKKNSKKTTKKPTKKVTKKQVKSSKKKRR